jgi:hypothetical protein
VERGGRGWALRRDPPNEHHEGARPRRHHRLRAQPHPPSHLPTAWRVFFIVAGWSMVLVGVAGLALPGIQGVLTILLGAALLSVASETAYWLLRAAFRRWPGGWRRVERGRRRIYRRIVGPGGPPEGQSARGAVRRLGRWGLGPEWAWLPVAWRVLPLLLLMIMVALAALIEPLVYQTSLWASKLPLAVLLLLGLSRLRGG